MGRALEILTYKVRLRHQSNFQLCFGAGKPISLPCLLWSLRDEVLCSSEARWRLKTWEPRHLLSQSHQGTQHLARRWHLSNKHHLELGKAMMMHGVFELFFLQNLFILGSALWPWPDLGMSVAVKHRAMCHFGQDVLALTLLSVCLLCTFLPSGKSIKYIIAHTNWGNSVAVGERMFCVSPYCPPQFFFI